MAAPSKARIIAQADWRAAFREGDRKAWVTFRKQGEQSIYSELVCPAIAENGTPYITATDGFTVDDITSNSMSISYNDAGTTYTCSYQAEDVSFHSVHTSRKSVECLDVTNGGLAVSCDSAGQLKLWESPSGEVRRDLEGHLGDVYTCRFFPSGMVVLSGGADMQLKIWSAQTGQCAATLKGHRAGIKGTAIVDKGRNIVSVSKDGTAKLWDVGEQACLDTISALGGEANCCALGPADASLQLGSPSQPPCEREVMTEGKLLLVGIESGNLHAFGLQSRKKVFSIATSSAVNCCKFLSKSMVACGTQDGQLMVLDLRNTSEPVYRRQENRSAILDLLPYQQGLFFSTGDGSCCLLNEMFDVCLELTGSDCDPVYSLALDNTYLYTSCRDGVIRKYKVS